MFAEQKHPKCCSKVFFAGETADPTPTVHYRLDENRLIQKLAEYLDIMTLRIQRWMCPEIPNKDSQFRS